MIYNENLVSIIIPTYNCAKYIKEAVDSCINQTYKNIEILVVDDGSTDNTREVLQEYISLNKIKYIYQKNLERSVARNNGLDNANGEFIQFLDSDDILDITKIEKDMKILMKYKTVFATYSGTAFFKGNINNIILKKQYKIKRNLERQLIYGNIFTIQSLLFRKNDFKFDVGFSALEDYEFWIRSLKNKKIMTVKEYLSYVRVHDNNSSKNSEKMYLSELKVLNMLNADNRYKKNIAYRKYILANQYGDFVSQKKFQKQIKDLSVNLYLLSILRSILKIIKNSIFGRSKNFYA